MKNLLYSATVATLLLAGQTPTLANYPQNWQSQRVGPGNQGGDYYTSYLYVCTRNGNGSLNMRYGAGTEYSVMQEIPKGTAVEQMDSVRGSDGFYWHKIYYRGSVGWARGDYLCD
jgi:uncharacterized protein YgiM (DUF1202 family)